jgi:hypothetical protein
MLVLVVVLLLIPAPSNAWSPQHTFSIFWRKVVDRSSKITASDRFAATRRSSQSSSLFSIVLPSNETETFTLKVALESSLRRGVKELSSVERRTASSSFERAVEQVHALFDLASLKEDAVSISSNVVLTALDGLVSRALQNIQTATDEALDLERQLKALEGLLGRVNNLDASPSLQTVESLWMMQQYHWQLEIEFDHDQASDHVERTVTLLQNWTIWASESSTMLSGHPPPILFLLKVLHISLQYRVPMSSGLWDLYSSSLVHASNSRQRREVQGHVLDLVSFSSQEWKIRQCQVLQNMLRVTCEDYGEITSNTTTNELLRALRASAQAGRAPDAAWLARRLLLQQPDLDQSTLATIHRHFLESLLYSNESGSLLYMERLLLASNNTEDALAVPLNCETFKLLLRKCSLVRSAGSGRRAERIFYRALRTLNETGGQLPDAECVYYVVAAYLQNLTLSHVRMSDLFVRHCVKQFGLQPSQIETTAVGASLTSWRIFDRLLEAYVTSASISATDERKALQRADELFRFFLVQHRNGRILTEEPDEYHLGHMVCLWNRSSLSIANKSQQKVTEYQQLITGLHTTQGVAKSSFDFPPYLQ